MSFYTVDRKYTLCPGQVCGLTIYKDINPPALQFHVDTLFPDGVSAHGEMYFLKNEAHTSIVSPMLETFFEYVRRARFPHLPSRFQALFAVDSLAAANQFKADFGKASDPIYRVEADVAIKADMRLLTAQTTLVTSYFGELYWSGMPHPEGNPFWELLLKCPVKICERAA